MNKSISIMILLIYVSCSNRHFKTPQNHQQDITAITININIDSIGTINILFKNDSDKTLSIGKPCRANTFLVVKKVGKEIQSEYIFKADPKCITPVNILAKQTVNFEWNYPPFHKLYNLEHGVSYEIYLVYYINYKAMKDGNGVRSQSYYYRLPNNKFY